MSNLPYNDNLPHGVNSNNAYFNPSDVIYSEEELKDMSGTIDDAQGVMKDALDVLIEHEIIGPKQIIEIKESIATMGYVVEELDYLRGRYE